MRLTFKNTLSTESKDKLLIIVAIVGSLLEYFDFMLFIFLAPVIAKLFFPEQSHNAAIIFTYAIISISYIFRPIGGILWGYLGDNYGRKTILCLSLILMAAPSLIIGFLPIFSQIGYSASIILVTLRILQGISLGGEVPGSITYISEKFKHGNYFFYLSWLTFGANLGVALGSQTLHLFYVWATPDFLYTVGWRIPFILGGSLAILGFLIRTYFTESESFTQIKQMRQICRVPVMKLWEESKSQVLCGIIICSLVSFTTSVFIVFLPNLLGNNLLMSTSSSLNLCSIGSLILAVTSIFFGYITKYINPALIIKLSMLGLVGTLFIVLLNKKMDYNPYYLVCVSAFFIAGINGVFFGVLADLFPTQVRFSGIAICYNVAYMISAGLTPLWVSYMSILNDASKNIIEVSLMMLLIATFTFHPQMSFYRGA